MEGNKLATVKPVTDSHALSVGAELVAQGFLLSTAMGLVVAEYIRSAWIKQLEDAEKERKTMEKEAKAETRLRALEYELIEAKSQLERLKKNKDWSIWR
jgi:hypothetical protein